MPDREKVMKGLQCLSSPYAQDMNGRDCENCQYDNASCFLDITADALALLKEQEPVKPTVSVDTWICSKCGHTLESQELIDDKENPQVLVHEMYDYCPQCGRAVKWDGDI